MKKILALAIAATISGVALAEPSVPWASQQAKQESRGGGLFSMFSLPSSDKPFTGGGYIKADSFDGSYIKSKSSGLSTATSSGSNGFRVGMTFTSPELLPDWLGLRVGYISLGEDKYDFEAMAPNSYRSGFGTGKFSMTFNPHGIEIGPVIKIGLTDEVDLRLKASYIYDLDSPKVSGTDKSQSSVQGTAYAIGGSLAYRINKEFSIAASVERMSFSTYAVDGSRSNGTGAYAPDGTAGNLERTYTSMAVTGIYHW